MWPSTSTVPSDGVMIPARTWSSVLLPAPLGPMTPSDSPFATLNDTWRSAQKSESPSRAARGDRVPDRLLAVQLEAVDRRRGRARRSPRRDRARRRRTGRASAASVATSAAASRPPARSVASGAATVGAASGARSGTNTARHPAQARRVRRTEAARCRRRCRSQDLGECRLDPLEQQGRARDEEQRHDQQHAQPQPVRRPVVVGEAAV